MSQPPDDQGSRGPGVEWLSRAVGRISSSAIRDLLALVERPDVISLAGGLPSPGLFPVAETRRAIDRLLGADPGALQYATTEGEPALREWLAARHGVAPDRVVVTHGSQQALDLVARTTVDPGSAVALADPGYVGAIQAMRVNGARLVALPTDADGLDTEALAGLLRSGLRPRLVYVVPNFANPTGASLSAARARRLTELADRFGFLLVEDDPYGAIRFAGTAAPGLATLSDRVITVGTISKVLFPGLRVGWVVAPAALAPALALMKQAMDLHTATLNQRIALHLLQRPEFEAEHLPRLRAHYRRQAQALSDALATELGDAFTFAPPQGGMFLWGEVQRPGIDTAALLSAAIDHGVAYVPGSAFSVEAPHTTSLRLSFATVTPDQLALGARRLADVVLARTSRAPAATGSAPISR